MDQADTKHIYERWKEAKVMALVAAVILAAAGIGLGLYRDHNLHHDERMTRRALSAGCVERHATVGGVTVNYAEGPSDGLALLLILPQTPMRTRCASRPRYRTAGRLWSSQDTTSTRRRPTISRGPSTRRAGRRRHGTLFREREPACVITDRVATPKGRARSNHVPSQPARSHPYGSRRPWGGRAGLGRRGPPPTIETPPPRRPG